MTEPKAVELPEQIIEFLNEPSSGERRARPLRRRNWFMQGHEEPRDIYIHGPGYPEDGQLIARTFDELLAAQMVAALSVAWAPAGLELVTLQGGRVLYAHPRSRCAGTVCAIHHPSQHHMRTWPQIWRGDIRLMERFCVIHECGHPDPDDLKHKKQVMSASEYRSRDLEEHGCCGCCRPSAAATMQATVT